MTEKNVLVEGYRFVVALAILWFHFLKIWSAVNNLQIGVEFFFILSGFLLANHVKKNPHESVGTLIRKKVKFLYPYVVVSFVLAAVIVSVTEHKNILILMYQNSHQLLLLTNYFIGLKGVSWFGGTSQFWFVMAQLWATVIVARMLKNKKHVSTEEEMLIVVALYAIIIRCSGKLNTNVYWKIGEYQIFLPLTFIRATAGMLCGCVTYEFFDKLNKFTYTSFAKTSGTVLSMLCMITSVRLSYQPKSAQINTYSWRTLIVVLLYIVSIECAFLFGANLLSTSTEKNTAIFATIRKMLLKMGRWSFPIYTSHYLVIDLMKKTLDMPHFRKRYALMVLLGTAIMSAFMECAVKYLRRGWKNLNAWIRERCIMESDIRG